MKQEIINAIKRIVGERELNLDVPENSEHGDYSTNVAMQMFANPKMVLYKFEEVDGKETREKYKSPREFAGDFVKKLEYDKELAKVVDKIEVAGPGFINFFLKSKILFDNLKHITKQSDTYGKSEKNKGKTVIVEYSSPNIAKPFTVGHLRSTIIGDAVANLLESTGWKVYRDNHLGDWGTQFGKQICAIEKWGNLEEIEKTDNPVKELVALYVRFHKEAENDDKLEDEARAWFKKLEDGDTEARKLWQKCVELSWVEFEKIYSILGVDFSSDFNGGRGMGEAFFEDKMGVVIESLKKKKLLKEGKEGAKLVFFDGEKYPPAMILKKDGATLYHTRDLATDKYRKDNYKPDLVINEVGIEQSLYFQQLFEIEKLLGWYKEGQRVHVAHGLYRFKDKKMSTRKGDVIWLEEVLEEAEKRAFMLGSARQEIKWGKDYIETKSKKKGVPTRKFSEISNISQLVGIGALKYNDLKRDPKGDITFDWEEILNMEGNSGPYIQYTVARANSVLHKAKFTISNLQFSKNYQLTNEEMVLMRTLIHFPEVVSEAAERYAPNLICNYLYDLSQKFNSLYNAQKIIGGENENLRLMLTSATGQVLKNGLKLLGIKSPEKM